MTRPEAMIEELAAYDFEKLNLINSSLIGELRRRNQNNSTKIIRSSEPSYREVNGSTLVSSMGMFRFLPASS
jgi:hypothetical protein